MRYHREANFRTIIETVREIGPSVLQTDPRVTVRGALDAEVMEGEKVARLMLGAILGTGELRYRGNGFTVHIVSGNKCTIICRSPS